MPLPAAAVAVPALTSVATGLLSSFGVQGTNQANRKMARDQMRFQERMSSTAAQRAVEDFRKAGLNPALAYDRPASSPGGSTAVMQDKVNAGISSAKSARLFQEELATAVARKEAAQKENELLSFPLAAHQQSWEEYLAAFRADLQSRVQAQKFELSMQPGMLEQQALSNLFQQYINRGAANEAALNEKMGIYRPLMKDVLGAIGTLSTSAGSAARLLPMLRKPGRSVTDTWSYGTGNDRRTTTIRRQEP